MNETDLRFSFESDCRPGVGDETPLVDKEGFGWMDVLAFLVGIGEESMELVDESFLFFSLERSGCFTVTCFNSSLAYLSFSPSFFHAGTCFSTVSTRRDI